MAASKTPRLGRLSDQDQLTLVDDQGKPTLGPAGGLPATTLSGGGSAPAARGAAAPNPPAVGMPGVSMPPMASPSPPDALREQDVTPEEAEFAEAALPLIADAIEDDPDPEPEGSILLLDDTQLRKLFEGRLNASANFRRPYEDKWLRGWKQYHQILEGDMAKWKSKNFLPMVVQQVEAALPAFVAAIFDSGPVWEVAPTKPEREQQAKALTKLLDWYMREKTPAARRLRDWLWSSTLFGTGFLRVRWKYEEGTRRYRQPVYLTDTETDEQSYLANRTAVEPNSILASHPVLENINLWDALPAPHTKDDDDWPYFIERIGMMIRDLRAEAESGTLGDEGPAKVKSWLDTHPEQSGQMDSVYGVVAKSAEAFHEVGLSAPEDSGEVGDVGDLDRGNAMVYLYRMSTKDADVYFSADGTHVLGKVKNPYWFREVPIVAHHFVRIPGRIYGRGIADIIGDLQDQANFNYNKGNDAVQLALNAPIAVRRGGNALVEGQLAWQPGVTIPCRDPSSDIVPLKVPEPSNLIFRLEEHLTLHADRATGVNDIVRGQSPQGANTATEFAGLQSQVRMRLSQHVREIRTSMGRVGRLVLMMAQQFVDQPLAIRTIGAAGLDWVHVNPDDVTGEYDVIPSANSTRSNPTLMRADVIGLMPHVLTSPIIRQDKWMRHVLRVFEVPDAEQMVQPPPPPPRDPRVEELALSLGADVDPSPDENFLEHLQVHAMAEMAEQANPNPNPLAYQARKKHLEKTLLLQSQVLAAQAGLSGADGPPQQGSGPPGGTEARRGAERLGEAQGSHGSAGRAPGPSAPNRRE